MGMEGNMSFETPERSALFNERSKYENELQASINKENSIRDRYGADLENNEDGKREIAEVQREQRIIHRMMDDVDNRLRNIKTE